MFELRRPWRALAALAATVSCALAPTTADAAGDPTIAWKTISTEHFDVHTWDRLEPIARKVASVAETAHATLTPALGWAPHEKTQIVLTDDTDFANGSATALPYNTVRLYVTAPDDLSPLADYDDWYVELVTHEYTHILHTDHITGLPAIYNAIFGKSYSPNQVQPRWLLEGLAVLQESRFSSAGRNRSSTFDMFLRADVLEDSFAPIDQVSHSVRRWPQGNLWYLYGSRFLEWLASVYGHDALKQVAADYGSQIIPFGINRAIHRAVGKTYVELWDDWQVAMKKKYEAQRAAVLARGQREGRRVTFGGNDAYHPRYVPAPLVKGDRAIAWYRSDGHHVGGLWVEDVEKDGKLGAPWLLTRTAGASSPAFFPDGGVLYDSVDVSRQIYFFWDLFRRGPGDVGAEAAQGERLTSGLRANEPSVSPDGTRVAFTKNASGTTALWIADLDGHDGTSLSSPRVLVPSKTFQQIYTPRWSPDGKEVAYSTWTEGGYRDLEIVEVATGKTRALMHDRALDTGPVFSPDGKRLFWSSDRGGIANVYTYELATGTIRQVTNVVNGAYQPDVSADGKHLVYVGYTHAGYDLFEMELDPSQWLEPLPVDPPRPEPPIKFGKPVDVASKPYNPLPTLRPYTWSFTLQPDAWGQSATVTTNGEDVVGHHAFALALTAGFEKGTIGVDAQYWYHRLPVDLRAHGYRFVAPRGGYRFSNQTPAWVEQTYGGDLAASYPILGSFSAQSLSASYSLATFGPLDGFPEPVVDPATRVNVYPQTGRIGALHLGWAWSNVRSYLWSVGAEKGFALSVALDVARKELGSDYDLTAASYNASGYLPMPWGGHHVLALHAQGGVTAGNYGRRGAFALGGYAPYPLVDAIRNLLIQPGVALRGYEPASLVGDAYQLFDAEYRFPIWNLDRGIQTLPIFFKRVYGNAFVDYGDAAFTRLDLTHMKLGLGGELLVDFTYGYFQDLTLRLGLARGTSQGGVTQTYVVLSQLF
jgi:hypothetical protein